MSPEELELLPVADPDDVVFESLPTPASGETAERFRALRDFGRRAPALGRVSEAHHDAMAILAEAGRARSGDGLHAVWAAGGPDPLRLERGVGSGWRLRGSKHWCSAAMQAKFALVTADSPDRSGALVRVDLSRPGVCIDEPSWQSPAMAAVQTRTVRFDVAVDDDDIVGVDDWYLIRPGFWHGAVGVAACWAGCIDGIVGRLMPGWRDDPHARAHLGAIDAALWNLQVVIDGAAAEIDAEPIGTETSRQRRALRVRHVVDTTITDIITRIGRALGPGPLAHTVALHRHLAEIDLYRRQSHAERDLDVLGSFAAAEPH